LFSLDEILKKDEIAVYVDEHNVFAISCIHNLLKSYGFDFGFSFHNKKADKYIEVHTDRDGNSIMLEYEPAFFEESNQKGRIGVTGFLITPHAELYLSSNNATEIIDLREYIRIYPKNVFSRILSQLLENLQKKSKYLNLIYI